MYYVTLYQVTVSELNPQFAYSIHCSSSDKAKNVQYTPIRKKGAAPVTAETKDQLSDSIELVDNDLYESSAP